MTSASTEIEFKFSVKDSSAFTKLVDYLDLPRSVLENPIDQINHFFDSPASCLHGHQLALRIRQEDGSNILTIKGDKQSVSDSSEVLTERIEEESALSAETANALIAGSMPVEELVQQQFSSRAPQLVETILSACSGQRVQYLGKFRNQRIQLPPVTLNAADYEASVEFELDTSYFPDGNIDYEIEVEISADSDSEKIGEGLIELLKNAGIDWGTAPSKAVRFFQAISSDNSD